MGRYVIILEEGVFVIKVGRGSIVISFVFRDFLVWIVGGFVIVVIMA